MFCRSETVPAYKSPIWGTEHHLSRDRHVVYMSLGWPLLSLLPSKWGEIQILNDWHLRIQRIHLSPFWKRWEFPDYLEKIPFYLSRYILDSWSFVLTHTHTGNLNWACAKWQSWIFQCCNSVVLKAGQWDNWLSTQRTKDERRETSWAGNGHMESNVCWFIWSTCPFVSNQI